jgi:putative transposase
VRLYFRFPLSFGLVEDMLAYRGIFVTHKTVYEWAEKFGRVYAKTIRRRTPRFGDKWHLDECLISIKGAHHILWRAVDQDGFVLDALSRNVEIPRLPSVSCASFSLLRAANRGL